MKRIEFTVKYSFALESTVGTNFDKFTVDLDGEEDIEVPFNFVMYSVDNAHPNLFKKYLPGKLDFKLNGKDPEPTTPLKEGDEIWFGLLPD